MIDSNLDDLDSTLKTLALKCVSEYSRLYPERKAAVISITWRSSADQQTAYDNGLSKCKAGQGKHECLNDEGKPAAKAFDFKVFDEDGDYIADGADDWYADFGSIAEDLGLVWGGSWKHPDYDHCELKG